MGHLERSQAPRSKNTPMEGENSEPRERQKAKQGAELAKHTVTLIKVHSPTGNHLRLPAGVRRSLSSRCSLPRDYFEPNPTKASTNCTPSPVSAAFLHLLKFICKDMDLAASRRAALLSQHHVHAVKFQAFLLQKKGTTLSSTTNFQPRGLRSTHRALFFLPLKGSTKLR